MKRVLVLFLFIFVLVAAASPALVYGFSHSFDSTESPTGWDFNGSSGSSAGSNSSSGSFEVPLWVKVLEVENHGKASPFYDEVMDSPGLLSGLSIWDNTGSPSGWGDFSDTSGSSNGDPYVILPDFDDFSDPYGILPGFGESSTSDFGHSFDNTESPTGWDFD